MTVRTFLLVLGMTACLLGLAGPARACDWDTDCEVGSKCLKRRGELSGACIGGLYPGNKNDARPYEDPLDSNSSAGHACSWDTDCDVNQRCLKKGSALEGVCLDKRGVNDRRWKRR